MCSSDGVVAGVVPASSLPRAYLRLAALVAGAMLLVLAVADARAQAVPLRSVDWQAVLTADPQVSVDPDCFRPIFAPDGFCITVAGTITASGNALTGTETVTGFPLLEPDEIVYGDLDGDDAEEAVIRLFSGGTADTVGLLVYRAGTPQPRLIAVFVGYKLNAWITEGVLTVSEPLYFGFEGNCCPTALTLTRFPLAGDQSAPGGQTLLLAGERMRPVSLAEATVVAFYDALSVGRFDAAYGFLSPTFQATNPFETWRAGYATTVAIAADVSPGPAEHQVAVTLTATDELPSGERITRRFAGIWELIWLPDARQWLLDRAQIAEVP